MLKKVILYPLTIAWLFAVISCSNNTKPINSAAVESVSACYIVYDAGSSGTRLYVYEERQGKLIEHQGPKVLALADPVREIRGKTIADLDQVVDDVVSALNDITREGVINKKGKPKWLAFDWRKRCNIQSAKVLATAGMRLAEQERPKQSRLLWQKLKQKLQIEVGGHVEIVTKTLSGFEEGLYAWLTVRDIEKSNDFGIVEMGGASSQITFPCADCDPANDAVRSIVLDGKPTKLYSYSFLGLGQDEAPKVFALPVDCSYGIGAENPSWSVGLCANKLILKNPQGIRDPYNFGHGQRGTFNRLPKTKGSIKSWFLTGAFNYVKADDIAECCSTKGECYKQETSCFRPVYLEKYLKILNVPLNSKKQDVSWTQGEVVCELNNCLQETSAPVCRWMDKGCL